jgi:hypothetical protein
MEKKRNYKIEADPEFMEVLDKLEEKIKHATWDGVELSKRALTKILARKIKSSKLL